MYDLTRAIQTAVALLEMKRKIFSEKSQTNRKIVNIIITILHYYSIDLIVFHDRISINFNRSLIVVCRFLVIKNIINYGIINLFTIDLIINISYTFTFHTYISYILES